MVKLTNSHLLVWDRKLVSPAILQSQFSFLLTLSRALSFPLPPVINPLIHVPLFPSGAERSGTEDSLHSSQPS